MLYQRIFVFLDYGKHVPFTQFLPVVASYRAIGQYHHRGSPIDAVEIDEFDHKGPSFCPFIATPTLLSLPRT